LICMQTLGAVGGEIRAGGVGEARERRRERWQTLQA
jgi:hypothetical protein